MPLTDNAGIRPEKQLLWIKLIGVVWGLEVSAGSRTEHGRGYMIRRTWLLGALAMIAVPVNAQDAVAPPGTLPMGSGPYKSVMIEDASLPEHTIYRPSDLSAATAKLPVLVWGNGGCANAGNSARPFLTEIASYGYLVIAAGVVDPKQAFTVLPPNPGTAPGGPGGRGGVPPVLPPPATHTAHLIKAIDWAVAESKRPGSPLAGKIDASHIAVAGHSCGGVQAIEASADRRVATTLVMNSGMLPTGTSMAGGRALTKADLLKVHGPIAYLPGDSSDIAHPNASDDFERIAHVPVMLAWLRGTGHGGTFRLPNGGEYAGTVIAWLDWQLKGSARAGALFRGPACGLCANPRWVVRTKRM
jgi:dienelactone hydrolase